MNDFDLIEQRAILQARRSFWAFRQYMNPKMKVGWWNKKLAYVLQQFYEALVDGYRPRLVIQAPPQHGKSMMVIDFIAWAAGQNPELKTIFSSFSERLGVRANLRLQRMYDSEKYQKIFPKTNISRAGSSLGAGYTRSRELLEYVGTEGYFRNTTVGGSITGEGLDLGIIDDPVKGREQANSETIREKTWEWFSDDFSTRFSEEASLLIVLTRWHVDDLVGRLIELDPELEVVSYPALACPGTKLPEDDPRKEGSNEALFPEHKSAEFLLQKKLLMTESSWESLFQQAPFLREGNMFKPEKIALIQAAPAGTTWCRGWDFASVDKDGDYTASLKLGITPIGRYVIADVTNEQQSPDERDAMIKSVASHDGTGCKISIPQDPGQAGKSQALLMVRMLSGYSVRASPESGAKEVRADPFASQVNVGNVDMLPGAWNKKLIEQLRTFPHGKNDDMVDAGSRAFMELNINNLGLLDYYKGLAEEQALRKANG